jgi:hypothetical protein
VNDWLSAIGGSYDIVEYDGAQMDGNVNICNFLENRAKVTLGRSGL